MPGRQTAVLPLLFLLFSLPTCLFLAVAVPTGEPPDEPAHIIRADSLLHGDLFGERRQWKDMDANVIPGAGVTANAALLQASLNYFPPGPPGSSKTMSADLVETLHRIDWAASATFLYAPNTAVYMPVFYAPAAMALGLAHQIGLAPHAAILLGRITNSVCFAAIGLLALLVAQRGQGILFIVLVLPMTLSLAASFNQDGLLIAVSTLAAALLTRCVSPRGASYRCAGAALACVIAAKIAYLPLAGAMLIPLCFNRRPNVRRPALGIAALTTLPGLLWTIASARLVASPFVRGPAYRPGPLWPGDPGVLFHTTDVASQLRVLLHHPVLVLTLPLHGLRPDQLWFRLREMVGVLGQLDVLLPHSLYLLWYLALMCAVAADLFKGDSRPRSPQTAAIVVGLTCILLSCIAVYDIQYLSWTPVGAADVDGVQGRYGLPLLAFLAPTLPGLVRAPRRTAFDLIGRGLMVTAAIAPMVSLVVLPQVIVLTYYLR